MSLLKLGVIAILIVAAGLIAILAAEGHLETLKIRRHLVSKRVSIIAGLRSEEKDYEWMYLHDVTIPTRWHYASYSTSIFLVVLAIWLMLGRQTRDRPVCIEQQSVSS